MKLHYTFFIILILLLMVSNLNFATPTDAISSYAMGYYYLYNDDLEMAKSQFKLALFHEKEPPSELYAILSKVCNWLGAYEEAKQYAIKGLETNPENVELLELNAMFLISEGDYEEALHWLEILSAKRPYDLDVLISLAEAYDRVENEDMLIEVYGRMITINPSLIDAHLNLGFLYTKRGIYSLAQEEYQKVLELDPENEKAIFYLTYIYLSTGKTQEALGFFRKLDNKNLLNDEMLEDYASNLFIEGQDPTPVLQRIENTEEISDETKAIQLIFDGELEQAQKIFEQVISDNPAGITAYVGLINIAQKKNNIDMERRWRFVLAGNYFSFRMFDKALRESQLVKQMDSGFLENRYLLGDIYYALRDLDNAVSEYEYFADKAEEKGDVYLKLGILNDEMGNHEAAIGYFLHAIELSPESDQLYYYLGLEYRIIEEYENAVGAFKKAIELNEGSADYYFNLGVSYERMGIIPEAIMHLDRSIELDDTNPVALNYLGYLLADEGLRLDEAKELIHKALDADPTNGAYLDSMGWVYYRLSDYEKAREYLEQAIQYLDVSIEENYLIYDHLGDVYYVIGLFAEANETWKKALQIKYTEEIDQKIRELEEEIKR
ncbi:MAG: tetratricopeptide repeat protein [Spirochaetota bacterium]|nr:MAG: tetratricopeptide repeat protein [Spirochaetota bacterium]